MGRFSNLFLRYHALNCGLLGIHDFRVPASTVITVLAAPSSSATDAFATLPTSTVTGICTVLKPVASILTTKSPGASGPELNNSG